MNDIAPQLKKSLLKIIREDYQRCEFLTAVTHLLTSKLDAIAEDIAQERMAFNTLRDATGDIGMTISAIEKRLEEAEECYSRMVDALAEHKPDAKAGD